MSEQKLISPLLDGFVMGDPMSSHDGVLCCPAMRENTEEKYIVKIISVPASQKQLDALLLTGAYPDAASAMDYFKEMADGIVKEAELLKQLSKLEGFLSYDSWQIIPMEGSRLGYQVYLISPYKRSLEKYLRRNTMTHLGAVNLGLDLCAALSICRRSGFMHVDLKPSNIYLTGQHEFRIGDLGFVKLSSLKYTSLPSKYCSCYTPPELHDPLSTLNPTADIYAVGMILYQIYNDGVLPFEDKAPDTALPAPLNADYEMAEIILKACDPTPRKRWQTPIEMGKALVEYMKRNAIGDTPIVPPAVESDFLDAAYEPAPEQAAADTEITDAAAVVTNDDAQPESGNEPMSILDELTSDETAPDTQDAEILEDTAMTDEVSSILAQVEELMTDPVPAEETISEQNPSESAPEANSGEDDFDWNIPAEAPASPVAAPEVDPEEELEAVFRPRREPPKKGGFLKSIITIALLAALAAGGYFFYQNYYLLHIGTMDIKPFENTITVKLSTDADESLLTITCTDAYGNAVSSGVQNGTALFENLTPGTLYKIQVAAEGFHALRGSVSGTAATADQTKILDFTAQNGTEDGSVVLNFTVEGPEEDWVMEYSAEGENTQSVSFTGHKVTINNLTVGKTYSFSLVTAPGSELYIAGNNVVEFTAIKNVIAENLSIVSCVDGVLTAQWTTPADTTVDSWTVRCYNENGYDETITVTENAAQFSNISADSPYTVEVTAPGMVLNARAYVSANPTTITDITVDDSTDGKLSVTWNSGGILPEGGWLLMYALDSSEASQVIKCSENSAVIEPTVPGTQYRLIIQAADGSTVFGGVHTCATKEAAAFYDKSINAADVTGSFCPTPAKANWTYKDIADTDYTATYAPGSKVSMVLYSPEKAARSNDTVSVMFVIRDSAGNILPDLTNTITDSWNDLWNNRTRYCSLDLPAIPSVAGQYNVEVYFNRCLMITKNLTITE